MPAEIAAEQQRNAAHVLLQLAHGAEYCKARHDLW